MRPLQPASGEAGHRIATAADAYRLFRDGFPDGRTECLQVAILDRDRRVLAIDRYDGAADHLAVPTRAILARAAASGAAAMLIGHNHPSGDPSPSSADRAATGKLAALLAAIEVPLVDHLVFAGARCASFRQMGLL